MDIEKMSYRELKEIALDEKNEDIFHHSTNLWIEKKLINKKISDIRKTQDEILV